MQNVGEYGGCVVCYTRTYVRVYVREVELFLDYLGPAATLTKSTLYNKTSWTNAWTGCGPAWTWHEKKGVFTKNKVKTP
jgi:hypothetical protein